jgi:hypothetical protein
MTRITKGMSLRATPDEEPPHPAGKLRRWGGMAAAGAAALVLTVTGLTAEAADDIGQPPAAQRGSGGSTAGPTEDPTDTPPTAGAACVWTTDITDEVRPEDDIGRPPVPDAALVMERCNGVWTGSLAWLAHPVVVDEHHRPNDPPAASACSRPGSADAFLPGSRRVPVCWHR